MSGRLPDMLSAGVSEVQLAGRNREAVCCSNRRHFGRSSWVSRRALGKGKAPRGIKEEIVIPLTNYNGYSSWNTYQAPETVLGEFICDII